MGWPAGSGGAPQGAGRCRKVIYAGKAIRDPAPVTDALLPAAQWSPSVSAGAGHHCYPRVMLMWVLRDLTQHQHPKPSCAPAGDLVPMGWNAGLDA